MTKEITAERTIQILEQIFSRFGLPDTLVSNNATTFTSAHFKIFCQNNGIRHLTSPAYHPASNGQAENSVKTFKNNLQKILFDKKNYKYDIDKLVMQILYANRNTIHFDTGKTPYELMFNRKPILRWNKLIPDENKNSNTKLINVKKFEINDLVYFKDFISDKWRTGNISNIIGSNCYIVLADGKNYKRHADHITKCKKNINNEVKNDVTLERILNKKCPLLTNVCNSENNVRNANSVPYVQSSNMVMPAQSDQSNNNRMDNNQLEDNFLNPNVNLRNNSDIADPVMPIRRSTRSIIKPNRLNL